MRIYAAVISEGDRWLAVARRSDDPDGMVLSGNCYKKGVPQEVLGLLEDLLDTSALRVHADASSK